MIQIKPPINQHQVDEQSAQAEYLVIDVEQWLHIYEQMLKIRYFEETVNELYKGARMPGLAHLYSGEEAIAVGVCEALRRDDYITSTHRGHGHCLAKGAQVDRMFAELLGKASGYCSLGNLKAHAFEAIELLPKSLAPSGVIARDIQGRPGGANRHGGSAQAFG